MNRWIIMGEIARWAECAADDGGKAVVAKGFLDFFSVNLFRIFHRNFYGVKSHRFYFWKQTNGFRREGRGP